MESVEQELKLVPASEELLETLARVDRLGPFAATSRRREVQRNSFFDTSARSLSRERVGFRRRVVAGEQMARWTIKGESEHLGGVSTRAEIELALDPDMPPALALSTLRDAARSRGAVALGDAVDAALASGGAPLGKPYLEMETHRRIVDLEAGAERWEVELALDRVRIVDHAYAEIEIEAELKRGNVQGLALIRQAIEGLGRVTESNGSKLSRAMAHLETCHCRAQSTAKR